MKRRITLILLFVFTASVTFAQEDKQEQELIQSAVGTTKKQFVEQAIDMNPDTSDTFWEIYNGYEERRQNLARIRISLLNKYINNYENSNVKKEKAFMDDVFQLQKREEKNIREHYNKMERRISTKTAMQWFLVEQYLKSAVDYKMYSQLPIKK